MSYCLKWIARAWGLPHVGADILVPYYPCQVVVIHLKLVWQYASFQISCCDLTHWGWVTLICVSYLTIIGSDNGLSPGRRQAIIWASAWILLIRNLGTNSSGISSEIRIFVQENAFENAKWRQFCLGLNVLNNRDVNFLLPAMVTRATCRHIVSFTVMT